MKPFLATVFVLGGVAMNAATVPATGIAIEFRVPFTEKFQGTGQFERKHRCARTAAPPAIDGRLDDRAWADSEPIVFGNGNAQTSVRICHDAAALYLAFECREPAGRVTQATDKDRDTDVWRDDAIEICIGPPQEQKLRAWYLFIISAANSVYDQKMRFSKPFGDPFNPEFSHATRIAEGCWTAEVALPATELGMPGWPTYLGVSLAVTARAWARASGAGGATSPAVPCSSGARPAHKPPCPRRTLTPSWSPTSRPQAILCRSASTAPGSVPASAGSISRVEWRRTCPWSRPESRSRFFR